MWDWDALDNFATVITLECHTLPVVRKEILNMSTGIRIFRLDKPQRSESVVRRAIGFGRVDRSGQVLRGAVVGKHVGVWMFDSVWRSLSRHCRRVRPRFMRGMKGPLIEIIDARNNCPLTNEITESEWPVEVADLSQMLDDAAAEAQDEQRKYEPASHAPNES